MSRAAAQTARPTEPAASAAPEKRAAALRPRNAATLIILDRSGRGAPKLLMGRRHDGHTFMPGKFVFPGGRIELEDRHMPVAGTLNDRAEAALAARVTRPPHHLGRALALAAIRETFEETGLMIGTRAYGPPDAAPDGPWAAFREEGVLPDLEALQFIARAITPPQRPKRFDTRFFAVDRNAVAGERGGIVGPDAELVELAWVDLKQARALDLPRITAIVLDELEARLAAGFSPMLPVPYFREVRGRHVREEL
ncbi:NUDIX domain-containing protein [uncultured Methylobacterium sp.]|jgi:8-oxo-dGTP pyrophosphatase MutT (NUDIX family)|uniref:NUDIX hydrolase n=1 Tax=uncultured Methylobacterium sp. TaxID=157278 RepID=UPI002614F345|nr:NUDIX domain-containing protein [uncultured Methylobacterium sp.]